MPQITYHYADESAVALDVEPGTTIMRAAVSNGLEGIIGECGGQAMCATCHIFVRNADSLSLPEVSEDEDEMLDCTATERRDNSRLGCQITLGGELDSLDVDVPESQI